MELKITEEELKHKIINIKKELEDIDKKWNHEISDEEFEEQYEDDDYVEEYQEKHEVLSLRISELFHQLFPKDIARNLDDLIDDLEYYVHNDLGDGLSDWN